MKTVRALLAIATAGLTAMTPAAWALEESSGESSSVLACFYECKEGLLPTWWQEVTTLMLVNAANRPMVAGLVISNGNHNIIAYGETALSAEDLDEVNICRTLYAASPSITPPSAGMVEIILMNQSLSAPGTPTPETGTYSWVKNVVGKFFKTQNEPFLGQVAGVGKTGCRVVPQSVTTVDEIIDKIEAQVPQPVTPILIEQTADVVP